MIRAHAYPSEAPPGGGGGRWRRAQYVSWEARVRSTPGAWRVSPETRAETGRVAHCPYARRPPPALGPAAGAGWRAQVLGGPEGTVRQPCRQTPRGKSRGSPARVRRLREIGRAHV